MKPELLTFSNAIHGEDDEPHWLSDLICAAAGTVALVIGIVCLIA